jgi:CubicO group peptidase (beta-lactamase class C family)
MLSRLSFLMAVFSAALASARTWTEAATERKIEADYVSSNEREVVLRMPDRRQVSIGLDRLSPGDLEFIKAQATVMHPPGAPARKTSAGADRFKDVPPLKKDKIPVSGEPNGALAAVDDAILGFMVAKGIPALSFALSKDGKLLHNRAFGWSDADLKSPLATGMSLRLASITKPVNRAAIETLIGDGKLKLDDRVFDVLELGTLVKGKLDPRWKDITIQHLLDHKGGWDRDKSGDFTFNSKGVSEELHVPLKKLEPVHLVRYALARPLDFDPGAREVYSNFGYILLARVVEKLGGRPFVEYLRDTIGKTAGMTTMLISRSDPPDRAPGEVWYCLHPEYPVKEQPWTLRMETKDGSAALACSADDYCRFLETYSIVGKPRRAGGKYSGTFFGSTPGVTSVCSQRPDGICYCAIANRRPTVKADWNKELKEAIDGALQGIADKL